MVPSEPAALTRFVVFAPHGMVMPAEAFRLWLDLQARGFTLAADDRTLRVSPPERLTRQDCIDCRRWKWHLLMFISQAEARIEAIGPPHVPQAEPPRCPHCDSATPPEPLGHGWHFCSTCGRTFHEARR